MAWYRVLGLSCFLTRAVASWVGSDRGRDFVVVVVVVVVVVGGIKSKSCWSAGADPSNLRLGRAYLSPVVNQNSKPNQQLNSHIIQVQLPDTRSPSHVELTFTLPLATLVPFADRQLTSPLLYLPQVLRCIYSMLLIIRWAGSSVVVCPLTLLRRNPLPCGINEANYTWSVSTGELG